MKISEGIAIIEAILFASGDPITLDKLSEASEIDKEDVVLVIDQLERRYNVSESGLRIIRLGNAYQLTTRIELAAYVRAALENRRQTPLSQAAMECLAIIAYNQPVTKSFVEQVRGVDSSSVVNTLVERGLLSEAGRLDLPGRPVAFKTTDVFLRAFGISSLEQLPQLPDQEGQLRFENLEEITADNALPKKKDKADENDLPPNKDEIEALGLDEFDNDIYAYEE